MAVAVAAAAAVALYLVVRPDADVDPAGGEVPTIAPEVAAAPVPEPITGEVPAVLGMAEPDRPGASEWLGSGGAPTQLDDLLIDIDDPEIQKACFLLLRLANRLSI